MGTGDVPTTHYDNLKVAKDAPSEVIRAAYRALTQRYHPDRNPDPEAARIMQIINRAYEVLSDPERRREHDLWIEQEERSRASAPASEAAKADTAAPARGRPSQPATPPPTPPQPEPPLGPGEFDSVLGFIRHIFFYWWLYAIAIFAFCATVLDRPSSTSASTRPYSTTAPVPEPVTSVRPQELVMPSEPTTAVPPRAIAPAPAPLTPPPYEKPLLAPNGSPWPMFADYVDGFPRLNTDGLSTVTVDNSRNTSDVFVKLVSLQAENSHPVRQFYIPAGQKFTAKDMTAGRYDVRYRDLDSGGLSRSEEFMLEETEEYNGTRYSMYEMTLYKVENGNLETYPLPETDF